MTDEDVDHRRLQRNLADLRRSRNLFQREVAKAMGVPQSRVGHIETGVHGLTLETVARYVQACGGELSMYAVFEDDDTPLRVQLL